MIDAYIIIGNNYKMNKMNQNIPVLYSEFKSLYTNLLLFQH